MCIQNLPVVFAIDRAGLVGSDGETHQGIFDFTYLSGIPNMHVMAPKNKWELSDMLKFAFTLDRPAAIRYPRGEAWDGFKEFRAPVEYGRAEWIAREEEICLFALGSMVKTGKEVRDRLKSKGHSCSLINARFMQPLDEEALLQAAGEHKLLVSLEENVKSGGLGEKVMGVLKKAGSETRLLNISLPDAFIEHGSADELKRELSLDAESIEARVLEELLRYNSSVCQSAEL